MSSKQLNSTDYSGNGNNNISANYMHMCFFPLKISKLWKLFKFPVVQSGSTAGPLVNPIPLVPEKNQGLYPFGISWIFYWNTHVNTPLNMYWGKICICILFKCYLFKTNFEVSNKLKKPKNNQFRAKVYTKIISKKKNSFTTHLKESSSA